MRRSLSNTHHDDAGMLHFCELCPRHLRPARRLQWLCPRHLHPTRRLQWFQGRLAQKCRKCKSECAEAYQMCISTMRVCYTFAILSQGACQIVRKPYELLPFHAVVVRNPYELLLFSRVGRAQPCWSCAFVAFGESHLSTIELWTNGR